MASIPTPIPPRLQRASHAFDQIYTTFGLCSVQNFSFRTAQGAKIDFHPSQFLAEEDDMAQAAESVRDTRLYIEMCRDDMTILCETARDICQAIRDEQRRDLQIAQANGLTQDKDKTFHPFLELPAEIQLKVWEQAAQPPPSPLYYQIHKPGPGSAINEPAAAVMQDVGLWTACIDSSKTMVSEYAKEKKRVEAADYDKDKTEANSAARRYFDRIAQFKMRFIEMKGIVQGIYTDMVASQARKEALMERSIRQYGPTMKEAFRQHWGGHANLPVDALKRLLESLEMGNSFYVRNYM